MNDFHTITQIAKARNLGSKWYKVRVAVKKLKLVPVTWVGHTRLFDSDQRLKIEAELDRIIAEKAARSAE